MKCKISILFSLCCLIAITDVSVSGQAKVSDQSKDAVQTNESFNSISREEIEMLVADISKSNPAVLKKLADDPELKRQQIESLKQLLAFASQAQKAGLTADPTNRQEMDNIRSEIIAVNYDKEVNRGKPALPPFGYISANRVAKYWSESDHEPEFQRFLDAKVTLLRASNPEMTDREITGEEKTQARDIFAKIAIYIAEYEQKSKDGTLTKAWIDMVNLNVKLQQAQFLARLYSEKIADQIMATDDEVAAYFAAHPDLDPVRKRATAQGILDRALAGENFAALANKFSQDPGNTGADGVPKGGLYKDVPKGRMLAPFEGAALSLKAGQIAPELVESDFGFHIIKLERKLGKKKVSDTETYDVRHILISTSVKDPEKPNELEMPAKKFVRYKLETEKEKALVDKIVATNNIQVPDDFTVPKPTPEPAPKKVTKRPRVRKK